MSFDGFLSFGGIEILNAARTQSYIHNLMPAFPLVRHSSEYDTVRVALEQAEYRSPFLDGADWVETSGPDSNSFEAPGKNPSHRFYGMYPLSVEGIGDSTMTAAVTEGILDGGSVGAERDSTRSIRVHGFLVGADMLGAEAGLAWLRNALRANSCGMHGDLCGYSDLRFFLSRPDVCDPLWQEGYQEGETLDGGPVDPGSSPLVAPFWSGAEATQPQSFEWLLPPLDGVVIRWGAYSFDGLETLEEHGPVFLRRTNVIPNPSFTVDATTWSEYIDDAPSFVLPERIVGDAGPFGRVGDGLATIKTNWLPDPSFENGDPVANGWRSSGTITAVVDGTAPDGTHVLLATASPTGSDVEVSLLGPGDHASVWWTMQIGQIAEDVLLEHINNSGVVVDSELIPGGTLTSTWNTHTLVLTNAKKDHVLRVSTPGTNGLKLDAIIAATSDLAFFDGDTVTGGGFTYSFPNGFAGRSMGVDPLGTQDRFESFVNLDTPAGAATLSFDMRATETSPTVTVNLLDNTATIIASTVVTPGPNWTRYALGTPFGGDTWVQMLTDAQFDIDNIMLEASSTANTYFDGSTPADPEYTVEWLSTPNSSASRMTWTGSTLIEKRTNFRPFLYVDQGSIADARFNHSWSTKVDMILQLDPYDRTYHRVSTTRGVQRIKDYEMQAGVAIEVDFILTAANPAAFSTNPTNISFPDMQDPIFFQDEVVNLVPTPSMGLSNGTLVDLVNLVPNPSGEAAFTGYTAVAGTSGTAAVTNPVSTTAYGTHVLRCTWSVASSAAGGGMYIDVPVVAGSKYSLGLYHVKPSITQRLRLAVEFRTSSTTISTTFSAEQVVAAGVVSTTFKQEGLTAPATATVARLRVESVAGTSYANWSIASYLEMDGVIAVLADLLPAYFAGDTAAVGDFTYAWTSTAHLSSSNRVVPNIFGYFGDFTSGGGKGTFYRTSEQHFVGLYAARQWWHTGAANDGTTYFGQDLSQSFGVVVPGQTFVGSGYVRANKGQRFNGAISWFDVSGAFLGNTFTDPFVVTAATWTRWDVTGVAPAGAVKATLAIGAITGTGYSRWVAGDTLDIDAFMLTFGSLVPYFDGATPDSDAYDYSWTGTVGNSTSRRAIHAVVPAVIIDPDLPVVPSPPQPPTIPDLAITEQNDWLRYFIDIPSGLVPLWASTIPNLTLSTKTDDVRQVRVRFHPNPFGLTDSQIDPTDYCGEFLLSYLPANSALTVSGVTREAYAIVAGSAPVPASQLLYGTDGAPMTWPELSCALAYVMTIDIPPTVDVDNLEFALSVNSQE